MLTPRMVAILSAGVAASAGIIGADEYIFTKKQQVPNVNHRAYNKEWVPSEDDNKHNK